MKILPLAVSSAALLLAVVACSTPQADTRKLAGGAVSRFHKLDQNSDGKVTFAEFNAGFADLIFDTYGRGLDGTVSLQEWDAIERANENKAQSSFRLLDRNHDGKLSRDELSHGKRRDAVVIVFLLPLLLGGCSTGRADPRTLSADGQTPPADDANFCL